jgi:hypothetical protein
MKFKAKVAVQRNGRTAYWTLSAIAMRMVQTGMAQRRGQGAIELPGEGSAQDQCISAQVTFRDAKPERLCYGAHTPVNTDRLTFAQAVHNAHSGIVGGHKELFMQGAQYGTPLQATKTELDSADGPRDYGGR